ncbi:hypothetical protein BH11VER1_BH11VER1_05700 [soil metagenome]
MQCQATSSEGELHREIGDLQLDLAAKLEFVRIGEGRDREQKGVQRVENRGFKGDIDGYGEFTVGNSQIADTVRSIQTQREHHLIVTFEAKPNSGFRFIFG